MPAPDPDADYWTTQDVADHLGVAATTVYAYRSRGTMPAEDQRYGNTPLWKPATITAWHAQRKPTSGG